MKDRGKVILYTVILVAIDMIIKVIIHTNYMDTTFDILPPFLYFTPVYNVHYNYIASLLNIKLPISLMIGFYCLIGIVGVFFLEYLNAMGGNKRYMRIMTAFGYAGILCAIFSNIFWPGCLDYIYLKPYFVFDLKDVYLNVFAGLIIIYSFMNRNHSGYEERFSTFMQRKVKNLFSSKE